MMLMRFVAEPLEVADKQLTSEEQGKAYPSMCANRELEGRVQKGFAAG